MELSPETITLVGVVCVALGILAGLLINSLFEGGDDAAEETTDEAPPGGKKGRYTPVFRVWREKQAGTLVVELDGKAMINPEPLSEEERDRLERTMRELRAWLGMGLAGSSAPAEPAPVYSRSAPVSESTVIPAAEEDLSRAIGAPVESTAPRPVAIPPRPVRIAPPASVKPAANLLKGKDEPVIAPAAKSIVMQIEDILQDMIAGTDLERNGLHLLEDPVRGVIVQVGGQQFEGIGSVTDPYIKGVLQSAVQEWEKSQ